MSIENRPFKLCSECNVVKPLEGGYYKTNKWWHKKCKDCHNSKRLNYSINSNKSYVPRAKGWMKLPETLRNKIMYDIYVRVNFKHIHQKYKDEEFMPSHQTLLRWNRNGQIPKYIPPNNS